jgi:uncharacterized metal-binding protein
MPSGKAHLKFELVTLPLWTVGGAVVGVPWKELVIFTFSYVGASLLLSPDVDLADSAPARRWGVLRLLWLPYAYFFRHRGISHSILFGPLTRVLYLGFLAFLVWVALYLALGVKLGWRWPPSSFVAAFACGVYLSNLLHVLLDHLVSLWRHRNMRG